MATLRDFQDQIAQVQSKENAKQRAIALLEKEKEANKKHPKLKERDKDKDKEIDKEQNGHTQTVVEQVEMNGAEDDRIQELITAQESLEQARDLIASLVTAHKGEYILHLGSHPPRISLFDHTTTTPTTTENWKGTPLTPTSLVSAKETLQKLSEEVGVHSTVLFSTETRCTVLLRLPPTSVSTTPEVRCAVVGNVDSGKSTTLGVLTRGGLDDGRGRARVGLFRHKHEIETGRTSSVGMEILGFDTAGNAVLPATSHLQDPESIRHEKMGWDKISAKSAKIISFIDLAGHEKYLKTTLYGLTSGAPSLVLLMVGANAGLIGMSKEHLAIALALSVPVAVCITKIDMTPPNILEETLKQVVKILKSPGCRKTPVFVQSLETAIEVSQIFAAEKLCPIFQLSNVTGEGLEPFRVFLNLLPPSEGDSNKFISDQPLEYAVTEVWSVPYVGTVVNGIVNSGRIRTGDAIMIGPDSVGGWANTTVKSIQRKRAAVEGAEAGQCVSLALKRVRRSAIRKGMVIVAKSETPPPATRNFEAQVLILYHNTTLKKNYQAMLHCGAIRQTARVTAMDHPQGVLRTGDRATVEFQFIAHPEYLKVGQKLLFREGKTKGLGVVTKLL